MTDQASHAMNINIPPIKREWNVNTMISVVGFVLMLAGMAVAAGQFTEQMKATSTELAAYKVATEQRIAKLESDTRQLDNLSFRMAAAEAVNALVTKGIDDLRSEVSQQSGDIRVVKELLERIERQTSPASFSPLAFALPL